ncbi:hypothetical protein BDV32DRAFT_148313 [Aspergillus pseudonomiae]|uniref:Uncharacterized protein n=1 Tax=Aspergillus pseudonomiae TaxID=1506151 RepID=A0A5N7DKS8_9EURO|nr:uncharacterized protein BDV37DRAFT_280511 [Aspergillus pseudonomiae]KAB8261667.1 hypothetical protein BDV32DRAFT_148313 [Aspergillus pseudonomiae]KAE8406905.1 hypothetical protein BDV37DRAFT_280511 [Aspergillus pseudonomiae]
MQFAILSQIACATLFIRPIQGGHLLASAPTSTDVDRAFDPLVTGAPMNPAVINELDKRQAGSDFVAWWAYSDSWSPQTCDSGSAYVTWSTYGQCCATSDSTCNYATACAPDGRIQYYQGEARCDPGHYCEVYTILPSSGSPLSDKRDMVMCPSSTYAYPGTWYRQSYALTTDVPTSTATQRETETNTATQRETKTVTQTVETGDSMGLQGMRAVPSALGAFLIIVLLTIH